MIRLSVVGLLIVFLVSATAHSQTSYEFDNKTSVPGQNQGLMQPKGAETAQQNSADSPVEKVPQYPYPPYHNPYYTGNSAGEIWSKTVQWATETPFVIVDRVSNYLDRKFFSKSKSMSVGNQEAVKTVQPGTISETER